LPNAPDAKGIRIDYDGVSQAPMPRQLLLLAPGDYRIAGDVTTESAAPGASLRWTAICVKGQQPAGQSRDLGVAPGSASFQFDVHVVAGCDAQELTLAPQPGERPADLVIWFSNISAEPIAASTAPASSPAAMPQ
jgi:hypothetical protein